ncbi:hypothetical protein GCM10007923_37990 [Shinella yambaruensis]|uniref:Uncharacterized protein n=1 Tax=Shinella yambaruensis TaxID=415996 RepID=A0ABQ5ZIG8_9HYPH|nr:hypothetical protein GCM10007923_37990 [Shinella yambaruensis]
MDIAEDHADILDGNGNPVVRLHRGLLGIDNAHGIPLYCPTGDTGPLEGFLLSLRPRAGGRASHAVVYTYAYKFRQPHLRIFCTAKADD